MKESVTSESHPTSKPPVSERKAAANRANAQHSTGPRTPEGKARACLNALRHGILAKAAFNPVIDGEERRAEFEAIIAGLAQEFQPRTVLEQMTVQQLAGCYWKLAKVWTFEQEAAWRASIAPLPVEEFNEFERHYQGVPLREQVVKNQDEFFAEAGLGAPTIASGVSARTVLRYQGAINAMITRCLTILERRRKERSASDEPFEELDYIKALIEDNARSSKAKEPEASVENAGASATHGDLHKRTQEHATNATVSSRDEVTNGNGSRTKSAPSTKAREETA